MNRQPINNQTWTGIRAEFTLPTLQQARHRLSELMEDPEPVMQQLVRVFIDDGTFCPGFQFLPDGQLHPTVIELFRRAMALSIPHNYFTVWMITTSRDLAGSRPVELLRNGPAPLLHALESYRWRQNRLSPVPAVRGVGPFSETLGGGAEPTSAPARRISAASRSSRHGAQVYDSHSLNGA